MKPHEQAKAWREKRNLTVESLSELTGYSVPAILKFEAGFRNKKAGDKHSEWTLQRYRNACAAVDAQLAGRKFSW